MTKVLITDNYLTNIGNSIRNENGTTTKYKPSEMSTAIDAINSNVASELSTQDTLITIQETTIDSIINALEGKTTGSQPILQEKTVSPSISNQTVEPDNGYDGLSQVTINAVTSSIDSNIKASNIKSGVSILGVTGTLSSGITPTGELAITSNGTYDVTNYASANVNVASSGSGELQYATGVCDIEEGSEFSSGDIICTVTDLGFTPKFVYMTSNSLTMVTSWHMGPYFNSVSGGLFESSCTYVHDGGSKANINNDPYGSYLSLNIIDGGFEIVANSTVFSDYVEYVYIAIG